MARLASLGIVNLLHVDMLIDQEDEGAPSVLLPTLQLAP
jgi:hypothetical protein